jgi:SAM-dependent methyltransferase
MESEANVYSPQWFEFFHFGIDEARTIRETEFVCSCSPRPEFQKILDVCCGMGRHARALCARGYSVVGVDRDQEAIASARELDGGPNYVFADIRDYQPTPDEFDVAIVMGQSFGHFDATTNSSVLFRLANGVRTRGRIILDVWNPEFFATCQGERELKTQRGSVRENKRVIGDRLYVSLDYQDGAREEFEWQLFMPGQMERLAKAVGLRLVTSCSGFDAKNLISPGDPRIQFVLQREATE